MPEYSNPCVLDTFFVHHNRLLNNTRLWYNSIYEIYEDLVINGDYYVYDIAFVESFDDFGSPEVGGLWVSESECSDCSLTGELNEPDFWEEE